ncbi:MAG: glucoamylase family protein, partial [Bacteroidota bacterium]
MRYFLALFLLFFACQSDPNPQPPDPEPVLTDSQLFDLVQEQTFQYFWEGAESTSGAARERYHLDNPTLDQYIVTTGGTGFGLMGILVAMERDFVGRAEGRNRLSKILSFLKTADRYHGAWPHWIDGRTGKTIPFSPKDDGGDIVETAFLAQGLLCVRQYFAGGSAEEQQLAAEADSLWQGIEWAWYQNGRNSLTWHWSPNFDWEINHQLRGYDETLIAYVLGSGSPDYPIGVESYQEGWTRGGLIDTVHEQYGYPLNLKHNG